MSAGDTALACIGVAAGLACPAPAVFDAWRERRTRRRLQRSAADTLATCRAIWNTTPHDISPQIHRTEDNQ
ncbi:hypothetical protein [Streptomyces sp. NPDC046161]|uniref:hypothetical protein n=1 Tax=Streptomyces sp. NPDC046161 TaxID=3155132 RepID=UPI0033E43DE9